MKIIKIVKKGSKYKIYLENEVIDTYDEIIIKYNLLYKKELTDDLIEKITKENNYYENYHKAMDFINKRLRSEYEVINYLNKRGCCEVDSIIDKLKTIGLINDEAFAKAYVSDKINLSLDGPDKIRNNLKKLKVTDIYIDNALNNIDESIFLQHIEKLINKKIKSTKYTGYVLKNKITLYLINLGYNKALINKVLNNIELNNNIDDEMEKIYKKLSLKYNNEDLKLKLKQKLYSKGFSTEKINEFINEKTWN